MACVLVCLVSPVAQAQIVLDFSPDAQTDNFFGRNALAKSAIEKAAADLNALLDTPLSAIGEGRVEATYQNSSAFIEWQLDYQDPSLGQRRTWQPDSIDANEVHILVGMTELGGDTAGFGGPGGIRVSAGGSGFPNEIRTAVEQLGTAVTETLGRGGGPVISELGFNDFLGTGRDLYFDIGPTVGALALDIDTNNDGRIDSDATLQNAWHYDAYSEVASGKTDLYSVALHEIIHAIGFGTSQSWDRNVSNGNWLGTYGVEANGGDPSSLVVGGHINPNVYSVRVRDGGRQKPVLSPVLLEGTRSELTEMDLAILRDIGWNLKQPTTIAGDFNGDQQLDVDDLNQLIAAQGQGDLQFDLTEDGNVDFNDVGIWVRDIKQSWMGDANLDGEFNTSDLVTVFGAGKFESGTPASWQQGDWDGNGQFGTPDIVVAFSDGGFELGPRNATAAVPEPAALLTLGIGLLVCIVQRRR